MWNSVESIYEFGSHTLRPGDKIVFTDAIDMGDKFTALDKKHGDGYFGNTNGMCNAATTLSELFGTEIILSDGSLEGIFYPNTAQAGFENWGPLAGKTAYDSFKRATGNIWRPPEYFVWIP